MSTFPRIVPIGLLAAASALAVGCAAELGEPPAPEVESDALSSDRKLDAEEMRLHELVNQLRRSRGLPELTLSPRLSDSAGCHTREMIELGYFAHETRRCQGERDRYFNETGAGAWGENLAKGCSTAEACFRAWRDSPGHDRNLNDPRWQTHGVVRQRDSGGRWFWTHQFGDVSDEDGSVRHRCRQVSRAAGGDRHDTAAALSRRLFPDGARVVVVASSSDRSPDALSAGPLAHALGGPLLLSGKDALPGPTAHEVRRLGASRAILIGGTGALSAEVERGLRRLGLSTERIAGASRYDTAARVALRVGSRDGLAFVASGADRNLVDALAAAGPAAALGAPILLVAPDVLPGETRDALRRLGIDRTIVVGGASAVSEAVVSQLPRPRRLAGASRYDTAAAVAQWAVDRGIDASTIYVARGDRLPDALAAGASGGVLVLTPSDSLHDRARQLLRDHAAGALLLGGDGALAPDVEGSSCLAVNGR